MWNPFKKKPKPASQTPASNPKAAGKEKVLWLEPDANPWGVRVLDVRPFTQTMLSTSTNPQAARNALSYGDEDGSTFMEGAPTIQRPIPADLQFRRDRLLAEGMLFQPGQMEHKWAIYFRAGKIICVRSWQRIVFATADVEQSGDLIKITSINGTFTNTPDELPEFTTRALNYLLRTHVLGEPFPAPLQPEFDRPDAGETAAHLCFSLWGNMVMCATPVEVPAAIASTPLRSNSLLHLAVVRENAAQIDAALAAGIPIDLCAADGLTPLHWSVGFPGDSRAKLLFDRGSGVDVRSDKGATPLMNAAQNNRADLCELFVSRGADVNAKDERGFTSLHRAAEVGHIDVVRLLLSKGATDTEAAGHTALSLATGRNHKAIVDLLRR